MRRYCGIDIGAYSYGNCFTPGAFGSPVEIGRYVSVSSDATVYRRDHPIDRLSTHPFFYNSRFGYVTEDRIVSKPLSIGHDAWIGARVVVTSGCTYIGIGSVIGAGAVVTRNVPDFAIVGGVPSRLIRMRFGEEAQARILESKWWLHSITDCLPFIREMSLPLDSELSNHPLLQYRGQ
jgi:acetyltransferase-like isoleucine patch superfamily enzyme